MKAALVLTLALCASPAFAEPVQYFGYVAVACGLDDPHDATTKTDYIDEVAGFTNLNQACVSTDPAVTADWLRRLSAVGSAALLHVEPALFTDTPEGVRPNPDRAALWPLVVQGIAESGVDPDQILFYLVDEPALRHLPPADVSEAARFVRQTYPNARTIVIDAYDAAGPGPIAPELDFWGFDAYAVPDPGAEPLYTDYLDRARAGLHPGQGLVLVMDAMHTPTHEEQGLSQDDMADVARAYAALAERRGDVAAILAYAWAGGIDVPTDRGVRDLPAAVQEAHREIGRRLLGR